MRRALLLLLLVACGAPAAQTTTTVPSAAKPEPPPPVAAAPPFEGEIEYVTEKELHKKCSTCPKFKTLEHFKGTKVRIDDENPNGFGGVATMTTIYDSATDSLWVLQPDGKWMDMSRHERSTSTSTSPTAHEGTETARTEVIAGEACRVWVTTSDDYRKETCWSRPFGTMAIDLKTEHYASNQLTERRTVVRIERKSIPDDVFTPKNP